MYTMRREQSTRRRYPKLSDKLEYKEEEEDVAKEYQKEDFKSEEYKEEEEGKRLMTGEVRGQ